MRLSPILISSLYSAHLKHRGGLSPQHPDLLPIGVQPLCSRRNSEEGGKRQDRAFHTASLLCWVAPGIEPVTKSYLVPSRTLRIPERSSARSEEHTSELQSHS